MHLLTEDDALPEGTLSLANTADVMILADDLRAAPAVALHFPKWTDGRAYSQAVLLRARLKYRGRIVASGDVVADMAPLLQRCGFDAARLRRDQRVETAQRCLGAFDGHYQRSLAERQAGLA